MSEITHRTIKTNGINMHIAEAGEGPLVLLVHGFPESWYSWRHQLPALADAGYHAVAPDVRGYGRTDAPKPIEAYSMKNMTADMVGSPRCAGRGDGRGRRARLGRADRVAQRAAVPGPLSRRRRG